MKRKLSNLIILLLIPLGVFHFSGCKKKEAISPPSAPKPGKPNSLPGKSPSVQKQVSSVKTPVNEGANYDFKSKKDPFKPLITPPETTAVKGALPNIKSKSSNAGDLLPIQSFDVSSFKVSGIIAGLKENKALVIDPAGKGYVVRVGMLMGNNDGHITRITASSIEVIEQFTDAKNKTKKRKIVLPLSKKSKETSK